MLTLNREAGRRLKEEGVQRALEFSGTWKDTVLADFKAWLEKQQAMGFTTVTIEAYRAQCTCHPATPKAWGSLPNMARAAGLIRPLMATPDQQARVKSAAPRTHAHPVLVWEIAL